MLIGATLLALILANSPWADRVADFWATELSFDLGFARIDEDLRHLVNDGAMTLFFFVVGLEIKRELLRGELAEREKAALPIAAALGGMLLPAAIYVSINAGGDGVRGWGIPMATDIAFALGVVALVGPRVPSALKVLLLALAIVDDLGAILVITIFYPDRVVLEPLFLGGAVLGAIAVSRVAGVRSILFYVIPGMLFWLAVLQSGVHATLAGVVLALLTPAGPIRDREHYHSELRRLAAALAAADARGDDAAADAITEEISELTSSREPPLDELERALHPWTTFIVIPLFALANAGLQLTPGLPAYVISSRIGLGVLLGLLVGKPLGVLLLSWIAVRVGLARLPAEVNWRHLAAVGVLSGIGFTVSLFVTGLAFASEHDAREATAGIFVASLAAASIGFILLRRLGGERQALELER